MDENAMALLVLISRLGDIGTTYLATPKLKLEANPVARRLRWPFAFASLFLALLPYWSVPLSLIILAPSLLVSAANAGLIWLVRSIGEEEYFRLAASAAANSAMSSALLSMALPPLFIFLLGGTVIFLYPEPEFDYGYYLGLGILTYGIVLAVYRPLAFFRLRKLGANEALQPTGPKRAGD